MHSHTVDNHIFILYFIPVTVKLPCQGLEAICLRSIMSNEGGKMHSTKRGVGVVLRSELRRCATSRALAGSAEHVDIACAVLNQHEQ